MLIPVCPNRSNRSRLSHNSRTEKVFLGRVSIAEFSHQPVHLAFIPLSDAFPFFVRTPPRPPSPPPRFEACHARQSFVSTIVSPTSAPLERLCFHTRNVVKSALLDCLHCSLWSPSLLHSRSVSSWSRDVPLSTFVGRGVAWRQKERLWSRLVVSQLHNSVYKFNTPTEKQNFSSKS